MYTSGRTVKTSRTVRPTTIASATRDARRLADRLLDTPTNTITVDSTRTAHPETLAPQVRTTITFPAGTTGDVAFAVALDALPGLARIVIAPESVTITRNV